MNTLTATYCAMCEKIASAFRAIRLGMFEQTAFDPRFNKETYKELSSLSDYELRDIGITRGDIMHLSMGGEVHRGR
jgi:uncharacterized protein YjiS (DUF1127 family)